MWDTRVAPTILCCTLALYDETAFAVCCAAVHGAPKGRLYRASTNQCFHHRLNNELAARQSKPGGLGEGGATVDLVRRLAANCEVSALLRNAVLVVVFCSFDAMGVIEAHAAINLVPGMTPVAAK